MKNIIEYVITFLVLFPCIIYSQGWTPQTSNTTEIFYSVNFDNDQTGWACGNNGVIRATTNSGVNWLTQTSTFPGPWYEVFFIDSQTGWLCGGNGNLRKTTNGGANW